MDSCKNIIDFYKKAIDWNFYNFLVDRMTYYEDKEYFVNITVYADSHILIPDSYRLLIPVYSNKEEGHFSENGFSKYITSMIGELSYGIGLMTEEDMKYDSDGGQYHDDFFKEVCSRIQSKCKSMENHRNIIVKPINQQSSLVYSV